MSLCRCRRSPVEWDRATSGAPGLKGLGFGERSARRHCRTWHLSLIFNYGVMFGFIGGLTSARRPCTDPLDRRIASIRVQQKLRAFATAGDVSCIATTASQGKLLQAGMGHGPRAGRFST